MSGYFLKIGDVKFFYKKKIFRLIPPLIIWDITHLFLNLLVNNEINIFKILVSFLLANSAAHLYYIFVLIQLMIIAPILVRISKSNFKFYPLFITFLYNFIILLLKVIYDIDIPLYNYWIFGWLTYFYLGIIIREIDLKFIIKKRYIFIVFFLSVLEGIIVFSLNNDFYSLATSQLALFNTFYSCFICIYLYQNKMKLKDVFSNKLLITLGDFSFGIYLSHLMILFFVKKVFSLLSINYYFNVLLIFIFVVIFSLFINYIYYKKIKGMILWKKLSD